jgi:hypothetical protein
MTCEHCDDGEGGCGYPYYGLAPHVHAPGSLIGSTMFLDKTEWPANFTEDPEWPSQGTYTHCPQCGAPGEKP